MVKINLRDFYPWYTEDEFLDVPKAVAAELFANRRYNKTHERTIRRNKVRSLNAEDGTEIAASIHTTDVPEAVCDMMEQYCQLCRALNALPEAQGRRIDAHYILGMSQAEIARAEGVSKASVAVSIQRGLEAMKKYLKKFGCEG